MVTNEERERKYADAITVGYAPEHRAMMARWFGDEVAAVMDVADAEQAELRAEVDALPYCSRVYYTREKLRAEAAEAKVARVEALADEWLTEFGPASELENVMGQQSVTIATAVRLIRAALDGAE